MGSESATYKAHFETEIDHAGSNKRTGFASLYRLAHAGCHVSLGTVIGVNITMAVLASSSWTGLVKNSYVAGQTFNEENEIARKQEALGYKGQIISQAGHLVFRLDDRDGKAIFLENVRLSIGRPAYESKDRTITLDHAGHGFTVPVSIWNPASGLPSLMRPFQMAAIGGYEGPVDHQTCSGARQMSCCAPGAESFQPQRRPPFNRGDGAASRDLGDGSMESWLTVPGVHCGSCIKTAETAAMSVAGVEQARLNLSSRTLTFKWKKGECGSGRCHSSQTRGSRIQCLHHRPCRGRQGPCTAPFADFACRFRRFQYHAAFSLRLVGR
ncbi:MAG: FixH family protein [Nitratireductor sp.]